MTKLTTYFSIFLFILCCQNANAKDDRGKNDSFQGTDETSISEASPNPNPVGIQVNVNNPRTPLSIAAQWIQTYQNYVYSPTSGDPESMVINTQGLINYLQNSPKVKFLQIYLEYNNKDLNNRIDLTIVGADTATVGGNLKYVHQYWSGNYNKVFTNFVNSAKCGVQYDDSLDLNRFTPIQFAGFADNSPTDTSTAQQYITRYQDDHGQATNITYSFLIDAIQLKQFLTNKNYQNPSTGGNVPYLEIYFACANNVPAAVTLIMVGVNNSGKHVYYSYQNSNYVFDQCVPCPQCNIQYDAGLDGPVIQDVAR